jgi:4-carboxymuconolactone decarboxylase
MKYAAIAICAALVMAVPGAGRADELVRFAPLTPEQLTPEQKAFADTIAAPPRNGKYNNPPFRAYIRSPELAPRLSELAILITARHWTAQYEWFAHYPLAIKAGLDPQVAGDIAHGIRPANMKDDEAALYDLAVALHRDKKVSDEIYKTALDKFGERGMMDIIGIIGFYDITSMTLITMQAGAPNDSVPPLPALSR